jgi:four helix bundle protein
MLNLNHKKLEVWKESIELIKIIYTITANFSKSELFGLTSQLRRAGVSIASNIAEGCSRKSSIERKRFFEISRSSLVEIDTQLEISFNLNYVAGVDLERLSEPINKLFVKLSNLISKTN